MSEKRELIELRKKVMEKEFEKMNTVQQKAVFHINGPLLILAGAGSGKTTVLVNRIANMIEYGNAYKSDAIFGDITDDDIEKMKSYISEGGDLDSEIKKKLGVYSVRPWNILAITFTNKAAGELKERIAARVPYGGKDIWASTFHSTCARILRRYCDRLGYDKNYTVYDTDDQKRLIKDCQKQLNIDDKILSHKSIINEISRSKDSLLSPKDYAAKAISENDFRKMDIAKVYSLYQERMQSAQAMDFDDLLYNTVRLFEENPDVLEYYQEKFRYIMVDEYQDTNKVQYRFVSMLAEKYNNICVVGDDDQSIYRFRGATIENILSFEETFENATVIRLEQNYRSTKTILDAANSVIKNNSERKGKTLWTENSQGRKITLHTVGSERDEAAYVADKILEGVANGRKFSDYAVLYRMNTQSNMLEQVFVRKGVPHRIIGGHRFYEREHIKDMTAYLQVISNHDDNIRLRRIINKPKRAIGASTVDKAAEIAAAEGISIFEVISRADEYDALKKSAQKLMAFVEMIEKFSELAEDDEISLGELYTIVVDTINYKAFLKKDKEDHEQRFEDVMELKTNLVKYEEDNKDEATLAGFLEEISLITDIDNYDEEADSVVLMTMHSAKGLEFPVVFIPGMEDGIFPGVQAIYDDEELQEERRLAYVAITRAKEELYLVKSKSRMIFGTTKHNRVSRFASEIPSDFVEETWPVLSPEKQAIVDNARPKVSFMASAATFSQKPSVPAKPVSQGSSKNISTGDTVLHGTFGKGVVLNALKVGNDTLLEIAFETVGTKKLMANFGKLEKLS